MGLRNPLASSSHRLLIINCNIMSVPDALDGSCPVVASHFQAISKRLSHRRHLQFDGYVAIRSEPGAVLPLLAIAGAVILIAEHARFFVFRPLLTGVATGRVGSGAARQFGVPIVWAAASFYTLFRNWGWLFMCKC